MKDDPKPPDHLEPNLEPWIEPELEARIVALVMGEASDFEREELTRLISQQPELAAFRDRMESTHKLLAEVSRGEDDAAEWKLSAERRASVVRLIEDEDDAEPEKTAHSGESGQERAKPAPLATFREKPGKSWRLSWVSYAAAACLVGVLGLSMFLPNVGKISSTAPPEIVADASTTEFTPAGGKDGWTNYSPLSRSSNGEAVASHAYSFTDDDEESAMVELAKRRSPVVAQNETRAQESASSSLAQINQTLAENQPAPVGGVAVTRGDESEVFRGQVDASGQNGGSVDVSEVDELFIAGRVLSSGTEGSGGTIKLNGESAGWDSLGISPDAIHPQFNDEVAKNTRDLKNNRNWASIGHGGIDPDESRPVGGAGGGGAVNIGGGFQSPPKTPTAPAKPQPSAPKLPARPMAAPEPESALPRDTREEAELEEESQPLFGREFRGGADKLKRFGSADAGMTGESDAPAAPAEPNAPMSGPAPVDRELPVIGSLFKRLDEAKPADEADDAQTAAAASETRRQRESSESLRRSSGLSIANEEIADVTDGKMLADGVAAERPGNVDVANGSVRENFAKSDGLTAGIRSGSVAVQNQGSIRAKSLRDGERIDLEAEMKQEPSHESAKSKSKELARGREREKLAKPAPVQDSAPAPSAATATAPRIPDAAKRGVARRQEAVAKADEAALRAGRLMADEDYDGAVVEFEKSLDLLPDAPVVAGRASEYTEQFAEASVALARQRAEEGRYDDAIKLAESVLQPGVDFENREARQLIEDLSDPEVYSPALSPEHIARIKRTEQALKIAESHIRLGDYEAAEKKYAEALGMDPYNSAARRSLQDREEAKRKYFESAHDHARASFLRVPQIDLSSAGDPSDIWLKAYITMREGDGLVEAGNKVDALVRYKEAQRLFDHLARQNHDWKPKMMDFRRRKLLDKIDEISAETAASPKSPPAQKPVTFPEESAAKNPFSTFSLHVSDVSFKLAQDALAKGEWPERNRIRVEEFVNAFDYGDPMPSQRDKVACRQEQAIHPFLQQRNLLRIAMRTAAAGRSGQTPLRLTIMLDKSGSMERPDRVATVHLAFTRLTEQLQPNDRVTLLSFARQPRLLADGATGADLAKLANLAAATPTEGGTNLEAALHLAIEKAEEHKLAGAQNRIVLITDGAANLGDANPERLGATIEAIRERGIAFDAAGVGAEGLNDEILEALTRKGDGRYYLLNRPEDADDGFAKQIAGALRPAAKNVKIQVEFNPRRVGRYKLIGFEKHRLKKEDFRNDKVDAAEMAAEEAGVALYQIQPLPEGEGDIGSVSVRFRDMSTGQMVERRWPIPYQPNACRLDAAPTSMKTAVCAAMLGSKLKGDALGETVDLAQLARYAADLSGERPEQLRAMIQQARELVSE